MQHSHDRDKVENRILFIYCHYFYDCLQSGRWRPKEKTIVPGYGR
jgi:hypothetical protein